MGLGGLDHAGSGLLPGVVGARGEAPLAAPGLERPQRPGESGMQDRVAQLGLLGLGMVLEGVARVVVDVFRRLRGS